jgi:hypothetical protein
MSSKKLLSEVTIRKFMKLANIEPLADGFINEAGAGLADKGTVGQGTFSKQKDHRNKKMSISTKHGEKSGALPQQGPGLVKEEEEDEDELLDDEPAEFEDEGGEFEDEELPGDEGPIEGDMDEGTIEGLVQAIADAIEDHTGVTVDVAGEGDEGGEFEGEEGGEELEEPIDVPPEDLEGAPEGEEEEVLEGYDMVDEDEIVNETFRRVKSRLSRMQKEERLLESLTQKIQRRLAQKATRTRKRRK